MKTLKKYSFYTALTIGFAVAGCADNELAVKPSDDNYPYRLIFDADEGGDLADAEDYGLEIKFADFIGDLPDATVTLSYEISDLTDDMIGAVEIDEVIYEDDDEEFEIDFTASVDGLSGTITLEAPLPEEFEVVFTLPGFDGAEGSFKFSITSLDAGNANIILGTPNEFEYEVLDHELAGSWEFSLEDEDDLDAFKAVFGSLSPELEDLEFTDVKVGEEIEVEFEFEYDEVNITLVYIDLNDEEVEIEIEGEYDFEDGEVEFEGSHLILGDDGEPEAELDFIIEAEYAISGDELELIFFKVIDEDNYEDGEELFASEDGSTFTLEKD